MLRIKKSEEFKQFLKKSKNDKAIFEMMHIFFREILDNPLNQQILKNQLIYTIFHDPECPIERPQITLLLRNESHGKIDISDILMGIEDFAKRYFARISENVEEFKQNIFFYRHYRLILNRK